MQWLYHIIYGWQTFRIEFSMNMDGPALLPQLLLAKSLMANNARGLYIRFNNEAFIRFARISSLLAIKVAHTPRGLNDEAGVFVQQSLSNSIYL